MGSPTDGKYDAEEDEALVNVKENSRQQPCMTRKRWIITGIVVAILVVVAVVIVVAVVVTSSNDEPEKSTYSKECGPFKLPGGLSFSDLAPTIISRRYTCPLKGKCWSGEKCFQCLRLNTWKVGNINDIPVCCPNCEMSGMIISNSECNCR